MQAWDWFGDRSLLVAEVALACCTLEVDAAVPPQARLVEVGEGDHLAVVVAGTVTDAALAQVEQMVGEHPAKVVSFGVCSASGGPYWDSYAVTKGIGQVVDVDRFVPGCPPTPQALQQTLDDLRQTTPA